MSTILEKEADSLIVSNSVEILLSGLYSDVDEKAICVPEADGSLRTMVCARVDWHTGELARMDGKFQEGIHITIPLCGSRKSPNDPFQFEQIDIYPYLNFGLTEEAVGNLNKALGQVNELQCASAKRRDMHESL